MDQHPDPDPQPDWMGPEPAAPGCDCHVCRPEASYDEADSTTLAIVLQHGWQVMMVSEDGCTHPDHGTDSHVHGTDNSDPVPDFAYTVGLGHRAGHPELLMSGLDRGLMHRALNGVARRVLDGLRLRPGDVLEGVLGAAPVAVERVSEHGLRETVTWSGWFHRRRPEALVLVWPTVSGVFAWQPGAPAVLDEVQPVAWRDPIVHTGALAADPAWDFPVPPDHLVFSCVHAVELGGSVLWVARESDPDRGEDWSAHCGEDHGADELRMTHLAHVVRAAPAVRQLARLDLDDQAFRPDVDAVWEVTAIRDPPT